MLIEFGNEMNLELNFMAQGLASAIEQNKTKGVIETAKDPEGAIKSVMKRNETGDEKIELERLKMSLRDNFVTPWVKANGVGDVDMARLAKSIDQIAVTYEFKNRPKPEDMFTSEYLPPAAERKL